MPGLPEIPPPLSLFPLLTSHLRRCDQVRRLRRPPPQRPRHSISPPSNRRSSWRKRAGPTRRPVSRAEFPIRSPASSSNGSSCAATTPTSTFPAMRLSSPPIRAGRASALAPPRRSGAVAGAARSAHGRRLFCQRTAADRQGPLRAGAGAAFARAIAPAHEALISTAWRKDAFSAEVETQARQTFAGLITPADDKARMDARFYVEDDEAGLRAAQPAGAASNSPSPRRASAVINKVCQGQGTAREVPAEARRDAGLDVQPHPMAAPLRQDRRGRRS